ncbi:MULTISPECIES: hypothetical protein [Bacillaceae]|uniref:Uncharacterized protein n=1 Tax=Shouchella hunanensis TaxID=766894 RepID=A0ABY7W5C8_9BACI|nr:MULTISPECIES: hypothetical protein [Bacillaceae]WDF03070.1 hypothetical protein PQ477_16470 [Shouchella hunanensis]
MKKIIISSFLTALFLLISFSITEKADAAYHPWQKFKEFGSTCEVRAWTDYLSYGRTATTVDFFLEQRGNCGTLSYSAGVEGSYWNAISSLETGSFANRTPVKKSRIFSGVTGVTEKGTLVARLTKGKIYADYNKGNVLTFRY